ncbi:magnesium chelatase subunit H [Chlorobium sp. N1]|uniref:magnesium chelatase subunit H n=1 Tax=Chlorobium sp. N1 TaxID=2491138 RepID=UPI00103F6F75|nr:magnesium chelatase subunit H [Chlorobium sp. N1]TCD47832.1 magnesium chelatase subunit H [Chlorobium sp. N1]
MHFVFLTMEATNNGTLKAAAGELNRKYGTGLEVSVFSLGLHNSPELWERLRRTLPEADFVFGSMLFSEEIVRPLEALLDGLRCPVCMITSNPALVGQTRLGRFSLKKQKKEHEGPPGIFKQWADKLKPKHSGGESQRQLALARNASRILKHLPGRARDIHTFIAAHQFWLNGSQENMERFLSLLIERYAEGWKGRLPQEDPIFYPDTALFHPDSPEEFESAAAFLRWQKKHRPELTKGPVAILTMRSTVLGRNMDHIEHLLRTFEARGINTCLAYSGGLDCRPALNRFFHPRIPGALRPVLLLNATGFSLVGGPAENHAADAAEALRELDVPCWNLIPLSFQPVEQWRKGSLGLTPLQTALSVAIPELDGTVEPQVYAGTEAGSDRSIPLKPEIELIAGRAERFLRLKATPNAGKKVAIVLFNFPPNLGNAGTAAFLNVFESLRRLLVKMDEEGYTVEVPPSVEALRDRLLEGNRLIHGTDGNVGGDLSLEEYRRLFGAYHEIEAFWGDAPGEMLNNGRQFHILGCRLGNVFVGQQPSFGYERDPMRLLMAKDAAPNHAFAAFYTWLEQKFDADAIVHFGTHGALEFMPGKQVGLGASCWPKRLIGTLPNFYCYSVNNPSEGAIARRRGMATLLSYLAPPLEEAGLYRELRRLGDLVSSWRAAPSDELLDEIRELARTAEIDAGDEEAPAETFVTRLSGELYRIEERMIPLGLHIMGEAPSPDSLTDQLALLASHPQPSLAGKSLPELVAARLRLDYPTLEDRMEDDFESQAAWRRIQAVSHEAVRRFAGNISESAGNGRQFTAAELLEGSLAVRAAEADAYLAKEAGLRPADTEALWSFLQRVMLGLARNTEIESLLAALEGRYVLPSPGNDLVRDPEVVPTGRNIHSLDPYAMPSPQAAKAGRHSAEELLRSYRAEHGELPESVALVLWGTDNLKSGGEGVAQALALLGTRTRTDELGKIADVELIPLPELGRPRIDVVMTVSGIFRDLLSVQVRLLDRAARLAAAADEPGELNFVRRHALQEMEERGCSLEDASNRVYSNAPGSYGANVNHLVESSSWEKEEELAEAFTSRKGFAVTPSGEWAERPEALRSALKSVSLTYQNIDSAEIGISDIDHYYEYLGGVSKTVERLGGKKPSVMVGENSGRGGRQRITSLEKMVALESRTKLLNPKWYEAMLGQGYEGVREIESHLSNTYGWSATASAVPNWTYTEASRTFLEDAEMAARMKALNPHATMAMCGRLLEANARGFWETGEGTLETLRELYADLESRIEGADGPVH